MIEARWLFDIDIGRVQVVVHPQSVVHSMVEFIDGSIIAPTLHAGYVPADSIRADLSERAGNDRVQTNFAKLAADVEEPDLGRFPALNLARRAGEFGGTMPAVLNAAMKSPSRPSATAGSASSKSVKRSRV